MGKEGKAYRFTGTALYDTWAIGTVSDGKIWPAIRVTSQNIPSPASRESPALGGWRNREEKLSPVTTLSPLWQTYYSGIVRDADLLTLNIGTPQGGNDLTDNPRFTSWSLWKRRKAETAAKNGSKEYRTASHSPDMRHAGLSLVRLVTRSLVTRDRERSKTVFTALRFLHSIQTFKQVALL